jgi:hypothetical protein
LVLLDQKSVGVSLLRIFVEITKVAVTGCGVEVKVILFDVLTMVALVPGQTKGPLFQDRVTAVPEREAEAEALFLVADSS